MHTPKENISNNKWYFYESSVLGATRLNS
jgi:hypothetical protein